MSKTAESETTFRKVLDELAHQGRGFLRREAKALGRDLKGSGKAAAESAGFAVMSAGLAFSGFTTLALASSRGALLAGASLVSASAGLAMAALHQLPAAEIAHVRKRLKRDVRALKEVRK